MSGAGTGTPATTPTDDAYISVNTADTYFANQLNVSDWTGAVTGDKEKALIMATKAIEQLNFIGVKTDSSQTFEFPRGGDTSIPQNIQDACAELALAFIKGVDEDLEYQSLGFLTEQMESMRISRNPTQIAEHIANGIPSIKAWRLLQPYMVDHKTIQIEKIP